MPSQPSENTPPPSFDPGSRKKLTRRDLARFPEPTLFHKLARVLCEAECLPRRELFEAWAVARRARRKLRGGRIVDVACGHGLGAWVMMLLDDSSQEAQAVDIRLPPTFRDEGLRAALELRRRVPEMAILVVSHNIPPARWFWDP